MLPIIFGISAGLALGWVSYAYRSYVVAGVIAMAEIGLVLMMAPVGPLLQVTATAHDMTVMAALAQLYDALVPLIIKQGWPWIILFGAIGYGATAFVRKGLAPLPAEPETRDARRRRIEAEMGFTDSYFD